MRRVAATTMVLALLSEACSSSYHPARSPRIAVVQEGGMPTLVRDGQSYSVGLFGGGLEDAVQGNPAAEEHASAYKTLSITGWSLYVAGLGTTVGGLYLLASENRVGGAENNAAGAALALGGVAGLLASAILLASAQPHLWDAVNIYNDGLDASFAYPVPPPPFTRPAPIAPVAPPGVPNAAPPAPAPPPTPSSLPPQR